jgi:hypothetical protein
MPVVVVPDLIAPPDDVVSRVAGVFPSLDALRETAARQWRSSRGAVAGSVVARLQKARDVSA